MFHHILINELGAGTSISRAIGGIMTMGSAAQGDLEMQLEPYQKGVTGTMKRLRQAEILAKAR